MRRLKPASIRRFALRCGRTRRFSRGTRRSSSPLSRWSAASSLRRPRSFRVQRCQEVGGWPSLICATSTISERKIYDKRCELKKTIFASPQMIAWIEARKWPPSTQIVNIRLTNNATPSQNSANTTSHTRARARARSSRARAIAPPTGVACRHHHQAPPTAAGRAAHSAPYERFAAIDAERKQRSDRNTGASDERANSPFSCARLIVCVRSLARHNSSRALVARTRRTPAASRLADARARA